MSTRHDESDLPPPGATVLDFRALALRMERHTADPEYIARRERLERAEQERERRAEVGERIERAGAPRSSAIVDAVCAPRSLPAVVAVRAAVRWSRSTRRGCLVVLCGPRGAGKTVAACVALGMLGGRFTTGARLLSTPRNGWSANTAARDEWDAAAVLVIDDMARESTGDAAAFRETARGRIDDGRVTVATTNASPAEWFARYCGAGADVDDALRDRLSDQDARGIPWAVQLAGESLRGGR